MVRKSAGQWEGRQGGENVVMVVRGSAGEGGGRVGRAEITSVNPETQSGSSA